MPSSWPVSSAGGSSSTFSSEPTADALQRAGGDAAADARDARLGVYDWYSRFVGPGQRGSATLPVPHARRSGFATSEFVDAVHLDREGATAFSLEMAEVLRSFLDGRERSRGSRGRW